MRLLLCLEVPGVVPCPCTGSLLFLWNPPCWNTSLGASQPEFGAAFMTPRRWQVTIHPVTKRYTPLLLLLHHFERRSSWLTGEILVCEPLCALLWNPCTQPASSGPPELSARPGFPGLGTAPGSRMGAEVTLLSGANAQERFQGSPSASHNNFQLLAGDIICSKHHFRSSESWKPFPVFSPPCKEKCQVLWLIGFIECRWNLGSFYHKHEGSRKCFVPVARPSSFWAFGTF